MQNFELPAAGALRDHFFFLTDKLSTMTAPISKLVLDEFEQTLMVMFVHANQHNYSYLLERMPPDAALRQVRQAEEYIEANSQRAITLEGLVEVTGLSAFSLFRAFKKSRGYSPLEFMAKLRLCRARKLLQQPDAATTVAEVASACGYADLGLFNNDYMSAFGEHPAWTLRRGKNVGPARH